MTEDFRFLMREFVGYCSKQDPSFENAIVGATTTQIDQLEQVAQRILPPEYRAFLEIMGNTPPKRLGSFFRDMTFDLDSSLAFYNNTAVSVPVDAIYIWLMGHDFEMFLKTGCQSERSVVQLSWPLEQNSSDVEPVVPWEFVFAESLLQCLYKEAFLRLRLAHLRFQLRIDAVAGAKRSITVRSHKVSVVAKNLGFVSVPYVAGSTLFYDRSDAALSVYFEEFAADHITICSSDKDEVGKLSVLLCNSLGFCSSQPNSDMDRPFDLKL